MKIVFGKLTVLLTEVSFVVYLIQQLPLELIPQITISAITLVDKFELFIVSLFMG